MFLPFFKFSYCRSWLEKVGRRLLGSSWQLGRQTPTTYPTSRDIFKLTGPPQLPLRDLTEFITKDGDYAVARGGFGNVWKCTCHMGEKSINVAVKSIVVYTAEQSGVNEKTCERRIGREFEIWAMLGVEHTNILPLYGYTNNFGPFPALVSPWAENGNLTSYLELKYERLTMVDKFNILKDVTAGLQYLHDTNVIHGDLTGANVLIYLDGTACIADFGLSLMYSEALGVSQASSSFHGSIRWMAPEQFEVPEDGLPVRPSKQGDIYSFGGIMLLVLTGKIPYYYFSYEPAIIGIISRSVKPERARYVPIPDKYWEFIEECWSTDFQHRPSIERVVQMVRDELELIRAGAHA